MNDTKTYRWKILIISNRDGLQQAFDHFPSSPIRIHFRLLRYCKSVGIHFQMYVVLQE